MYYVQKVFQDSLSRKISILLFQQESCRAHGTADEAL